MDFVFDGHQVFYAVFGWFSSLEGLNSLWISFKIYVIYSLQTIDPKKAILSILLILLLIDGLVHEGSCSYLLFRLKISLSKPS